MTTQYERVITALDARGPAKRGRYQCPAHGGDGYNLSVKEGSTGKALLEGHSCGCTFKQMMQSLDPNGEGLKPQPARSPMRKSTKARSPEETAQYVYRDESGEEILYRVVRSVDQDGFKTFRQHAYLGNGKYDYKLGTARRVLYNLPQICQAITDGRTIYITEGEKDAETVMLSGHVATCNPGGADNGTGGKFTETMFASLKGAAEIRILIDNDTAGIAHAKYLFNTLKDSGTPVTAWQSPDCNDITEHLNKGGTFDTLHPLDSSKAPTGWADTPAEEPMRNSWLPVDPASYLLGECIDPEPTICTRSDGKSLFYEAKVSALWGESGEGKTWIAHYAVAQEIKAGRSAAYIDFEDRASTARQRLTMLGCTIDQLWNLFHYVRPDDPSDDIKVAELSQFFIEHHVGLVVLDSVGEATGLDGADPNSDLEIAAWMRRCAKRLAGHGMTPVLIDHIPKGDPDPDGPSGSQRKRAAIDGAAYLVKTLSPFSKDSLIPGEISIKCKKDRHGTYAKNEIAGIATMTPGENFEMILDPAEYATKAERKAAKAERQSKRLGAICWMLSAWIWEQPERVFSLNICKKEIGNFAVEGMGVSNPELEEAVRVLSAGTYSTGHRNQRRQLEKMYEFDGEIGLEFQRCHEGVKVAENGNRQGVIRCHTPIIQGVMKVSSLQSDQSEKGVKGVPHSLVNGDTLTPCDDTSQELDLDLREDPKRFTQ